MSVASKPRSLNGAIEGLRGFLALAVFLGHLRAFLFVDYAQLGATNPFVTFFYLATSLGHEAVMVFFVLSGYLVGGAILQNLLVQRTWSWKKYLIQRMVRLWIVLIPTLVLGYAVDQIGMRVFSDHPRYRPAPLTFNPSETAALGAVHHYSVKQGSGFLTYVGNVFFLQDIKVKVAGGNGPLWSLAAEFWYYLLFPTLLIPLFGFVRKWVRLVSTIAAALLLVALPPHILMGFVIWVGGAALAWTENRLRDRIFLSRWHRLAGAACGILLVVAARRVAGGDYVAGLGGIFLCAMCLSYSRFYMPRFHGGPFALLSSTGKICYSLYACHMPIMCFLVTALAPASRQPITAASAALFVACAATIYLAALLFYWLTERNTEKLRTLLLTPHPQKNTTLQRTGTEA